MIFSGFSARFDTFLGSARELHDRVQIWSGTVTTAELRKYINTVSHSSISYLQKQLQHSVSLLHISLLQNSGSVFGDLSEIFFYIQVINFHLSRDLAHRLRLGAGELLGELLPLGEEGILRSGRRTGHLSSRAMLLHDCHPRPAIFSF